MKHMTLAATTVVALALLLTVGAPRASADTYDFTSDHSTNGLGTAPFGEVVLTQSGLDVNVVATLFNNSLWIRSGSAQGYNLKLVGLPDATSTYGGTLTSGQFTNLVSSAGKTLEVFGPGNYDGDGTGNFAFGITCPGCGNGQAGGYGGSISFTVTGATLAQLEVPNGLIGTAFVADIYSGQTGQTGPVDATRVPDGGVTVMLLGGALVGLETLRRRFAA